jgi:hypothetical protein
MVRRSTLETRLRVALRSLLVDEYSLFVPWASGRPVSELAVCSQLARHLAPQLSRSWDVDCEYNRAGLDQIKQVDGNHHRADLIVHRRTGCGEDGHNLLMVELKVVDASTRAGGTEESLSALVGEYKYRYGVYLQLDCRWRNGNGPLVEPRWKWFGANCDTAFRMVFVSSTLNTILAEARDEWAIRRQRLASSNRAD